MAVDQSTQSESARLTASKDEYVARGVATSPIFVAKAHGARLTDVDGREYIDFVGGIGTLNGGHTPEAVVRAVQEQAERYMHQCFSIAMYEPYIEVCRRICALHPGTFAKKALLVNSGAEAVENAVKIARCATNRRCGDRFDQGFHGRTMLTMTLTSKVMPYKKGFGPLPAEVYRAPPRGPTAASATAEALGHRVRKLFKSQVDPESVAAIIYEPVQGEGGFLPGDPRLRRGPDRDLPRARDDLHRRRGADGHWRAPARARHRPIAASSPISSCGASRSAAACRWPASRAAPS